MCFASSSRRLAVSSSENSSTSGFLFMADLPTVPPRFHEFYEWIGHCITQWSSVENELFWICFSVLDCTYGRAAIVYYRTPTIEARISLADELVRSLLPERERENGGHDHPLVKEWSGIVSDLRVIIPQRNLLAHSPVEACQVSHVWPFRSEDEPIVRTSFPEQVRRPNSKKRTLKMQEFAAHYDAVTAASIKLKAFREKMHQVPRE
jgi:hypothetical protein